MRQAACHPEQIHYAKGLCVGCYNRLPGPHEIHKASSRRDYVVNKERVLAYLATPHAKLLRRYRNLKQDFSMDPTAYQSLLEVQGGVCAICKKFRLARGKKYLSVDHDHTSGQVRGLLCYLCNGCLPAIEEDPSWGLAAAAYLHR
jgi:hypothetical protein